VLIDASNCYRLAHRWQKYCQIKSIAYAQVYAKSNPSNDAMILCTVEVICLGQMGNIQGTHKTLDKNGSDDSKQTKDKVQIYIISQSGQRVKTKN
jgi:hypothetical protein